MNEDYGTIEISYKDGRIIDTKDFNYYTIQGCMLVIGHMSGGVSHINLDAITSFIYTPNKQNEQELI